MGVGGQCHALDVLLPGMTRYPLYRRLGRPQGRSGRLRKISPPPGCDPRTVQLVASRYTNWAIPAHLCTLKLLQLTCTQIYNATVPKVQMASYSSSLFSQQVCSPALVNFNPLRSALGFSDHHLTNCSLPAASSHFTHHYCLRPCMLGQLVDIVCSQSLSESLVLSRCLPNIWFILKV
jgi:hypothetical protein